MVVAAISVAAAGGVIWAQGGGNPCDVLAERHLLDSITLHGIGGLRPSMEEAAEVAFADAGMAQEIVPADLDPVVHGRGNVVHVGVQGYWVMLARVGEGYLPVDPPRPCSALSEGEQR